MLISTVERSISRQARYLKTKDIGLHCRTYIIFLDIFTEKIPHDKQ